MQKLIEVTKVKNTGNVQNKHIIEHANKTNTGFEIS